MAHYIDCGSLNAKILRYQEINEDTGEWLPTWRGNLKDREDKMKFYEEKRERRAKMTPEELAEEQAECDKLREAICIDFMRIIKGRLSTRHFNKYDEEFKKDMAQNCILVMLNKIRNFRRDLKNSFSFFTQIAWVELVRTLRAHYEYKNQHVSLTFVQNFDDRYD